jgi:hypothetical protein
MTEKQARLIGTTWTKPGRGSRVNAFLFGDYGEKLQTKIYRIVAADDKNQSVVELILYVADVGNVRRVYKETLTVAGHTNVILDLLFTNDALTEWEKPNYVGEISDENKAKVKAAIEEEMAKLGAEKCSAPRILVQKRREIRMGIWEALWIPRPTP